MAHAKMAKFEKTLCTDLDADFHSSQTEADALVNSSAEKKETSSSSKK